MVIDWGVAGLIIALVIFLLGEITHLGVFHLIAGLIGIMSTISIGKDTTGDMLFFGLILACLLFLARSFSISPREY